MQKNDDEVRLTYEAAVYNEQLRLLQGEVERITITLLDLDNAARTLENLKAEDAIVQIGGGAFIKANIYSTHTLLPIGAGYLLEMDKEQGVIEMKKRIESTKKAIERLKEEFEKISKKLQEMNVMLRTMQTAAAINKRTEESGHSEYV